MNVVYPLFAASSWPIAVMLAVPVFVVLFGLAFFFARTPLQRLANMLLGLLGSVVVLSFSVWYFSELHFLRKCPACVSFHWRNQWSVQFSVARRFAISERKLVLQGFYLQQVTSPRLTIDLASKALSAGKVQRLPDANNSGKRIARFNLGRMGIFSESAVSEVSRTSQEDYAPIVGPTALAVGAALGVALSVLSRKGFTLLFRRFSKEKASPPPQDSSSGSSSKKS